MQKSENKDLLKPKRILLTGGHAATTAIAVIEELIRRNLGEDIYWIGAREAIEGKNQAPLESKILPQMGVKYFSIISGRIQRKFTVWTIPSFFKIPVGIFQAVITVIKIKPSVVLSFGGSASFPVVFAAWILGIPVIIHEQTSAAGLANRFSAFFASEVLLARKESKMFFDAQKTSVVGNPVMTQIGEVKAKEIIGNPPIVFITAGSRGSQIINKVILKCLNKLLNKYRVIHITGEIDYSKFTGFKNSRYEPYSWVDPLKIDGLYREADVVIARSGANTVAELMIVKRPCLLIPIPWSYLDEQNKNARRLKEAGIAQVIQQNDLTPEKLLNTVENLIANWPKTVKILQNLKSQDIGASGKVVDILEKYLQ